MGYSLAHLKREVKDDLRNTRPSAILVTLAYLAASLIFTSVVKHLQVAAIPDPVRILEQVQGLTTQLDEGVIGGQRMFEELLGMRELFGAFVGKSLLYGLIGAAVGWILNYGYQGYCLYVIRGKQPGFLRLLCAFPKLGWVLLSGFLIELFIVLWSVLLAILGCFGTAALMLFGQDGRWGTVLIVVLWVLLGVWMVSILLSYSMANYILMDEKVDALEAISCSKAMLRGRKWHLLILYLSFILWILAAGLIGSLVGGIGSTIAAITSGDVTAIVGSMAGGVTFSDVLTRVCTWPVLVFCLPYLLSAQAKFYDWMKRTDIRNGVWESTRAEQADTPRQERARDKRPSLPVREKPAEEVPVGEAPAEDTPVREPSAVEEAAPEAPAVPAEASTLDRPDYE